MQSVSSRIWTRVAVYISYDDNDYTTGTVDKCKFFYIFSFRFLFFSRLHEIFAKSQQMQRKTAKENKRN